MTQAIIEQNTASVTERAAAFVAGLDAAALPPAVLDKVRACIVYGFGIGLLCLDQATARLAERSVLEIDGHPGQHRATLLCSGHASTPSAAVFANAVLLHSRCQEDTSSTAHFGVSVLAVALALAESGLADVGEFIAGVAAGYEVGCAIEVACGRDTLAGGLRGTPLYGTLAAAATAARMLRLTPPGIAAALANAASFTGGTLQSIPEGSDEWRYQAGVATRNGLLAAMLARNGSVSARRAIEGGQGFVCAFARRAPADDAFEFGRNWRLLDVTFKPYPVCAHNQTAALIGAQVHGRIPAERIASLKLRINPFVVPGLQNKGPFTRVAETLMSTYFCCASACLYGTVTMAQLGNFGDPAVAALMQRIEIVLDEQVPFPSAVAEIATVDGQTMTLSERRRFSDFNLSRSEVIQQLNRLATEEKVPSAAVERLDAFASGLPDASPHAVAEAYALARAGR